MTDETKTANVHIGKNAPSFLKELLMDAFTDAEVEQINFNDGPVKKMNKVLGYKATKEKKP